MLGWVYRVEGGHGGGARGAHWSRMRGHQSWKSAASWEPLLPNLGLRRPGFQNRSSQSPWLRWVPPTVEKWLAITTCHSYLQSMASRRFFRKWFVPLIWLATCVEAACRGGLVNPWTTNITSANWPCWIVFLAGVISSRLPPTSLWSDVILSVLSMMYVLSSEGIPFKGDPATNTTYWVALAALFIAGIHSIVLFGSLLLFSLLHCSLTFLVVLFLGLPFIALAGYVDYSCANECTELEAHRAIIERLLDSVTNGFCNIDRSSGVIRHASGQFKQTVGSLGLVGKSFVEYMDGIETWQELLALCSTPDGRLQSRLVTCRFEGGTNGQCRSPTVFDAKIIPYEYSDTVISLCIQALGEKREVIADLCPHLHLDVPEKAPSEGGSCAHCRSEAEVSFRLSAPGEEDDLATSTLSYSSTEVGASGRECGKRRHTAEVGQREKLQPSSQQSGPTQAERARMTAPTQAAATSSAFVDASTQTRLRPPRCPSKRAEARAGGVPMKRRVHLSSSRCAVPEFPETPMSHVNYRLLTFLQSVNWRGTGCCSFHIAVAQLRSLIRTLHKEPCDENFRVYSSYQCGRCLHMNEEDEEEGDEERCYECAVCQFRGPHHVRSRWMSHSDSAATNEERLCEVREQPAVTVLQGGRPAAVGVAGGEGQASTAVSGSRAHIQPL